MIATPRVITRSSTAPATSARRSTVMVALLRSRPALVIDFCSAGMAPSVLSVGRPRKRSNSRADKTLVAASWRAAASWVASPTIRTLTGMIGVAAASSTATGQCATAVAIRTTAQHHGAARRAGVKWAWCSPICLANSTAPCAGAVGSDTLAPRSRSRTALATTAVTAAPPVSA